MRKTVLLAEDDPDLRAAMTELLRADGLDVIDVPDGADAWRYLDACIEQDLPRPRVHVLVTDLRMPGMSGVSLLQQLDALGHALPTVVVTGLDEDEVQKSTSAPGVLAVVRKPLDGDALRGALERALEASDERWGWR